MIEYELVKVYDWFAIEGEMCKRVGVKDLYGGYYNTETGEQAEGAAGGGAGVFAAGAIGDDAIGRGGAAREAGRAPGAGELEGRAVHL